MQSTGKTGPAIASTRGVPLPTTPRGGTHVLDRPRRDPLATSPFRGKPVVEFTPEQLARAGYRTAGTGEAPRPKKPRAQRTRPATERRTPGTRGPSCDYDLVVRLYTDERLTITQIGARTGYAPATIRRALDTRGVERDALRRASAGIGFDVDEAIRLSREGVTIAELAKRFGYSVDHLGRTMREHGHSARANIGSRNRLRFDRPAAVADYLAGASAEEVGRTHGVTGNAVRAAVRAAGHQIRSGRTHAQTPVAEIVRLYVDEQLSPPQIAARLDLAQATPLRVLKREGVALRDDRARNSGGRNAHPQELLRKAGQLYATGLSRRQVARQLGIGVNAVDKGIALVGGRAHAGQGVPLDDAIADQIVALYERIGNATKVAEQVDVSHRTVLRTLHRRGVHVHPAGSHTTGWSGRRGMGVDNASPIRDLLTANGATAADVRAWARRTGRPCTSRGVPSRVLVEDYLLNRTADQQLTA